MAVHLPVLAKISCPCEFSLSLYFICTYKWSWIKLCFREAKSQCWPHKLYGRKKFRELAVPVLIHSAGDYECRCDTAVQKVPKAYLPSVMCQAQQHNQGYSLLSQCVLSFCSWTAYVEPSNTFATFPHN